MSNALQRYFLAFNSSFHLILAVILGFAFRTASSWFVYGAQALDDYRHGLLPAYQLWAGIPSTLPEYRSPLLPWILKLVLDFGQWMQISEPVGQARLMCFTLGLFSLLAIFAAHRMTRDDENQLTSPLAAYLVAIHGLLPFASTRAFGESVALTLVLLGFGFIVGTPRRVNLGFFFLGLATLFRFQVGLLFVGALAVFVFRRDLRQIFQILAVGIVITLLQIGIDVLAGRAPMSTLLNYFVVNQGGAASYGVHPWYNPLLMLLAITFFPFSIAIFKMAKELIREHAVSVLPFILFVGVHCVIPHKEERFMYPIVGLTIVYMSFMWARTWSDSLNRWLLTSAFFLLNTTVLAVASFNNTQGSEIEPIAAIEGRYAKTAILDYESILGRSWVKEYYIRPPNTVFPVDSNFLSDIAVLQKAATDYDALMIITSNESNLERLNAIGKPEGLICAPLQTAGSLSDRIIYKLNPKRNQRRKPSWFRICTRELE